jgi:hypothetical protein
MSHEEDDDPTKTSPDEEAGEVVQRQRRKPRPSDESHRHEHRGCGHACRGAAAPDPRIASLSAIQRLTLAELFNKFVGNRQERIDRNTVGILTTEEVDGAVEAAGRSSEFGGTVLGRRALWHLRSGLGLGD